MLKEVKIENFRGFKNEATIHFAPITILIGRNNASKSSIMKFLMVLKQSLLQESGTFLRFQGEEVDLPSDFQKNVLSSGDALKFSARFHEEESPGSPAGLFLQRAKPSPSPLGPISVSYAVDADVSYTRVQSTRGEAGVTVSVAESQKPDRSAEYGHRMAINDDARFLRHDASLPRNPEEYAGLLARAQDVIRQGLTNIFHIGPSIEPLGEEFRFGAMVPLRHVGHNGEFALEHLWHLWSHWSEGADEVGSYSFLREQMEALLDVRDLDIERGRRLAVCVATNGRTGARTNIADFGFGVSQCLPVLVQGSLMHPNTILMVEEPEANVHLTAQLEMGGYFANLWNRRKVASIVETHSANMLLRLQRLIRDGELKPEEVAVAFFDVAEEKGRRKEKEMAVVVKNLTIDKKGTISPGLPMEFFNADLGEVLDLGLKQ